MTELNPTYTAAIQQISTHLQALCNAIDSDNTQRILTAQKELTTTTEAIWSHIENGPIPSRDKALARLLADAALKELPKEIQNPANYPRIQRELRLLKRSLELWA
ncbi:MAG: hypothetical protein KJ077_25560 [Anaerolineae bacterium]|nr:hypothetical protein [Anaerolineae bacterium]